MVGAVHRAALEMVDRYLAWHVGHVGRCRLIQCGAASVGLFLALAMIGGWLWWLPGSG